MCARLPAVIPLLRWVCEPQHRQSASTFPLSYAIMERLRFHDEFYSADGLDKDDIETLRTSLPLLIKLNSTIAQKAESKLLIKPSERRNLKSQIEDLYATIMPALQKPSTFDGDDRKHLQLSPALRQSMRQFQILIALGSIEDNKTKIEEAMQAMADALYEPANTPYESDAPWFPTKQGIDYKDFSLDDIPDLTKPIEEQIVTHGDDEDSEMADYEEMYTVFGDLFKENGSLDFERLLQVVGVDPANVEEWDQASKTALKAGATTGDGTSGHAGDDTDDAEGGDE